MAERGIVAALIGLSMVAGAGVAYVTMHELRPVPQYRENPPVPPGTSTVPKDPTSSPRNPPVPPPVFGPVPNVTVNAIPAPAPVVQAPAPVKKKKVAKKKRATTTKLQTQWGLPPAAKPFSLGDLFNVN